ncbi:MAG: TRAP transporter small permease [Desulfatiglandales bacterium]
MGIEWVGLLAFVLMMLITTVDVLGAKIFLAPLPGALDVMMLAQLICMAFAFSSSLLLGRHVEVEFFVPLLPRRLRDNIEIIIRFLCLVLFVLVTWQLFVYGHDLQMRGEVTSTVRISFYPFAYATAVAIIPGCLVFLSLFIESLLKVIKNEP